MQDWFISWVFVSEENEITARGWDIRREYTTTSAVDVAKRYIEEISAKDHIPTDRIILIAMNKL
ncbi:hypothetical protein [Pantoea sp. UYEF8]|uniref:hypothetical protein n=1 Tax=Pantoea sp. UYEF8 TaxID=1756394 RepID=UPI0033920C16